MKIYTGALTPLNAVGTNGVTDPSSLQEWYFPYEHKWVRKNIYGEWELLDWHAATPRRWLHIGRDDIIRTPEEALAAAIANRRME